LFSKQPPPRPRFTIVVTGLPQNKIKRNVASG
jgi:hypothetical protein